MPCQVIRFAENIQLPFQRPPLLKKSVPLPAAKVRTAEEAPPAHFYHFRWRLYPWLEVCIQQFKIYMLQKSGILSPPVHGQNFT